MHAEQQIWGVEINRRGYGNQAVPDLCLEWATWADKEDWQKKGVVVWSHDAQRVECFSAVQALQYLEHMRSNSDWEMEGIPILRQSTVLRIENTRKKKGKGKKDEEDLGAEDKSSKGETVVEERFRLSPDQCVEFLKILETNETALREMADEDERERPRVLREVYSYFLKFGHDREADEIDFSTRPFKWEKDPLTNSWVCDRLPNRGSVVSTDNNLFWQGCIERPDRFKDYSRSLVKLEDLLAVKNNQKKLAQDIKDVFDLEFEETVPFDGIEHDYVQTIEKNHGRIETGQCWIISEPEFIHYLRNHQAWAGLQTIALVRAKRQTNDGQTIQGRFYISSLPVDAAAILKASRQH